MLLINWIYWLFCFPFTLCSFSLYHTLFLITTPFSSAPHVFRPSLVKTQVHPEHVPLLLCPREPSPWKPFCFRTQVRCRGSSARDWVIRWGKKNNNNKEKQKWFLSSSWLFSKPRVAIIPPKYIAKASSWHTATIANASKTALIQTPVDEITVEQKYLRKTVKIVLITGNDTHSLVPRGTALAWRCELPSYFFPGRWNQKETWEESGVGAGPVPSVGNFPSCL